MHDPPCRPAKLIADKRAMTADLALRLEQWLEVSAGFWMNLQKRYELDVAAEMIGDEIECTVIARSPIVATADLVHST